MTELQPVSAPERIAVLDVIRGCALLGVLIVNVHEAFSGHRYLAEPTATPTSDDVATWFIETAISGKSITLLTCLFGLGFTIQIVRADERGEDGSRLFVRRLGVLFAIGACHATLLWWGDVTWQYAVMGFVLLAFRRVSERAVLGWAIVLILVPRLVLALPGVGDAVRTSLPHPADRAAFNAEVLAAILGHDYVRANLRQILYYISGNVIWYFPWLAGRFLLGYHAGKRRLFADGGAAHLALFRRLAAWGLGLGGVAAVLTTLRRAALGPAPLAPPVQLGYVVVSELAMLGVAVGYASVIVLLMQRVAPRRWLMILAPVGRMPLTIYLTQSVAATFVFYGWGLGLAGQIGAAGCLAISLAIFALQIAASHAWLRRFRFGPAEWLWRSLVYRRRQPMRL
jgi:uncharacterized protein